MKYGSVCSGIEAASVAWEPLGWTPTWFAEIESFPCAVLAHHWPDVRNWGDMTKLPGLIDLGALDAPDILVGGTPCQAFSVAGMRAGLADDRGQLTIKYVEVLDAIDRDREERGYAPAIGVWENVPGVLSSKDNAFGCFLAALSGESEELQPPGSRWPDAGVVFGPKRAIAWRILDAQYFGLAQRRRRVFLVCSARAGFHPAQVLFEFDGLRRDTPPSRKTGQDITGTLGARASSGGGFGTDFGCAGGLQPVNKGYRMAAFGEYGDDETASCMKDRDYKDATDLAVQSYGIPGNWIGRAPENGGNAVEPMLDVSPCQTTTDRHGVVYPVGTDCYNGSITGDVACTMGTPGSSVNASGPTVMVCHGTQDPCVSDSTAFTLGRNNGAENAILACFKGGQGSSAGGIGYSEHTAPTLTSADSGSNRTPTLMSGMVVRRLTPTECERLQGFPDGHTLVPVNRRNIKASADNGRVRLVVGAQAKLAADGPRYKSLGNSMAVNVMRWIGGRIDLALSKPWDLGVDL